MEYVHPKKNAKDLPGPGSPHLCPVLTSHSAGSHVGQPSFESMSTLTGCVTLDSDLTSLSLLRWWEDEPTCASPPPGGRDAGGGRGRLLLLHPVEPSLVQVCSTGLTTLRDLLSAESLVDAQRSGKTLTP